MVAERKAHHSFRLVAELKQFFAKPDGHDTVLLAVQNEQRCPDFPDPLVRAERILDEPAHRDEGIGGRADVGRGGERRIEDQSAGWPFGSERDGDAGADRFTPEDDFAGG